MSHRRRFAVAVLLLVLAAACARTMALDSDPALRGERGWIVRSEPATLEGVAEPPDAGGAGIR